MGFQNIDGWTMSNPYAAPQSVVEDLPVAGIGAMEAQRQALIRHEVQLKSVGSLYYLGGTVTLLSSLVLLGNAVQLRGTPMLALMMPILGLIYLALGYGFRRVQGWVRVPGAIIAVLSLVSFPVGTLIGGWILYLMFGAKGRQVLAPEYQDVIAATPHVKFKRSTGDWIAVGVVLLLLFGLVGLMLVGLGSR